MNKVIKLGSSEKYKRWLKNENAILAKQKYFITFPGEMENIISNDNPSAKFFNLYHPNPQYAFDLYRENIEKDADLIFVGALIKRKGVEDYLHVVAKLKEKFPAIMGKVIGFTGEREYLELIDELIEQLKIRNNVRMLGYVKDHYDVFREIKKSKVLLLPTYVDTGPRSIAEGMTVGTPVIAYNTDGLPGMIKDGFNGILVDKGNIDKLAEATDVILSNPAKARYLSDNAYRTAREKYSPVEVINNLIHIYNKVINDCKSAAA